MQIVSRRDVIRAAREKWLSQYRGYADTKGTGWAPRITFGDIRHALATLDLEKCTPEDLDEAIGANGWGDLRCDECEENHERLVRFGEEPDYEARWQDLCPACLQKGCELAK